MSISGIWPTPTAETRTTILSVPVNNIVDNLSWSKGKHSIQVGGNWRLVHQNHATNANSFNTASTNPSWMGGSTPQPDSLGQFPVDGGFTDSYQRAFANLMGTVPELTTVYILSIGQHDCRHFAAGWRDARPAFLGQRIRVVRAGRMAGEAEPDHHVRLASHDSADALGDQGPAGGSDDPIHMRGICRERPRPSRGQVYEPDLFFQPSGHFYGKPGFWPKSKDNFAPRFAVAYSPDTKTSIRAGAGISL